jgi:hypothetical protein
MALQLNNFVGFNTGDARELDGTSGSSTTFVSTGPVGGARTNSHCMEMAVDAATNWADLDVSAKNVSDAGVGYIFGVGFQTDDTLVDVVSAFIRIIDSVDAVVCDVTLQTDGDITVFDGNSVQLGTTATPLTDDTWHYIELHIDTIHATTGSGELFIDGISVMSWTNGTSTNTPDALRLRNAGGTNSNVWFDDTYTLTGATDATDRYGHGFEILSYQNAAGATATPDGGIDNNTGTDLSTGTWDDVASTPFAGGAGQYTGYPEYGSVDSVAITEIDGTVIGMKGTWYAWRGGGGGTTHTLGFGIDSDGDWLSFETTPTLNTNTTSIWWSYWYNIAGAPVNGDKMRQGFGTSGRQDILCQEMWCELAHIASTGPPPVSPPQVRITTAGL